MTQIATYRSIVLIGYQKAGVLGNRGQLLTACIGSPEFPGEWSEVKIGDEGVYLHYPTKKKMLWFSAELWLADTDLVKLTIKVADAGVGMNARCTGEMIFSANHEVPLIQVKWPGVGYQDYPLIMGRLKEVSRITAEEELRISVTEPHKAPEAFEEIRYAER